MNESNKVRVLNQPISSAGGSNSPNNPSLLSLDLTASLVFVILLIFIFEETLGQAHRSIRLIGFFSLCCALFGLRWFLLKRSWWWCIWRKRAANGSVEGGGGGGGEKAQCWLHHKPTSNSRTPLLFLLLQAQARARARAVGHIAIHKRSRYRCCVIPHSAPFLLHLKMSSSLAPTTGMTIPGEGEREKVKTEKTTHSSVVPAFPYRV
ncbi:hypothetical protein M378DRAFT_16420 [Amanita muscaria Koide BX008]|uniref:Transmembrane protein n=1 Tax=Amanita muscaria (strain Koide BX008) TaxID=946122 RepID=A0A0C2S3F6_AMAMK|nr:hypothetical protein M378DRAFT_16420 [Amanita muscaria Koide BX008]